MADVYEAMLQAAAEGFTNRTGPKGEDKGLTADLADTILHDYHFAIDAGRKLYNYRDGRYLPVLVVIMEVVFDHGEHLQYRWAFAVALLMKHCVY